MDQTITAEEADERFPRLLQEVREGQSFTITAAGRPVARIVPAAEAAEDREKRREAWLALVERLRSQPAMEPGIGRWTRDELYERD